MTSLKHHFTQTARFVKPGIVIGLAIAFTASAFPSLAQPAMSPDQIKQRIESDYGVKVLRIKKTSDQGREIMAVSVMTAPGDFNDAFQVNTLAVDPKTGDLIRQYRSTPNGMRLAAPSVGFRTSPRLSTTK